MEVNENLLVEVLIHCFTFRHKFMMNHTLLIKKAISMTLIFDFDMLIFLSLGDSAVFHCMLCLFVLRSYWKTQVSSPVMILPKNIWIVFNFLHHVFTKFNLFMLLVFRQNLGHIFAHTFCIPRSRSKIVCTDSLFRLSSSDIICTVNL